MKKTTKILLALLIATLLGGGGYFYLKLAKKPTEPPGPKVEEIDTANWQTYYGGPKGFEIKIPPEWSKRFEDDGPQKNDENEFWRDQVGKVGFIASVEQGFPQFTVTVKDSDLTMDDFGFRGDPSTTINGFPARFRRGEQTNLGKVRFGDFILIKNGIRFYYIEFESGFTSPNNLEKIKETWKTILSTFKSTTQ